MSLLTKIVTVACVALAVGSAACHVGEVSNLVVTYDADTTSKTIICKSDFVKVDVSTLKACGDGKGHCYDKTKGNFDPTQLEACSDTEICVPDGVLEADGEKAKSCKSLGGGDGACTSLLNKQLNDNKGAVPQDVCEDDERCAPCIDPRTGKASGACEPLGAHTDACVGGTAGGVELCCHGAGNCIQDSSVPEDQQGNLSKDICTKENTVCAPASLVNGKAQKCDVLGLSGVCLDYCFAEMLQGAKAIARGGCGPTEVCLPCLIGKGQGMPGCE